MPQQFRRCPAFRPARTPSITRLEPARLHPTRMGQRSTCSALRTLAVIFGSTSQAGGHGERLQPSVLGHLFLSPFMKTFPETLMTLQTSPTKVAVILGDWGHGVRLGLELSHQAQPSMDRATRPLSASMSNAYASRLRSLNPKQ